MAVFCRLDHRAKEEAKVINSTKHDILKYVGGNVSLEMQCPKLLWLKKNLPISCWKHAKYFFDLPDFLTWKCTDDDSRSLCSVVCKWNYDAEKGEWPEDYFRTIGLEDLAQDGFSKLGRKVVHSGQAIGTGLTMRAADDLGLLPNIPVSASLIDAHAGALALFGCNDELDLEIEGKLALICGTSSCHMSISDKFLEVQGIWGPYKDAIVPQYFLHEAGQSATGLLLDELVKSHPAYGVAIRNCGLNRHLYEHLSDVLKMMKEEQDLPTVHELTKDFHIWPDFHGNRSPLADHTLRGMMSGLTLTYDERNLAVLYLAVLQSLAYGTRHIIEKMEAHGRRRFEGIFMCGGLSKNEIFVQVHSDICNIPVFIPDEPESVLLGAAILGAVAAKVFPDIDSAVRGMAGKGHMITPNAELKTFHDRKYRVFQKMLHDQLAYRDIMSGN